MDPMTYGYFKKNENFFASLRKKKRESFGSPHLEASREGLEIFVAMRGGNPSNPSSLALGTKRARLKQHRNHGQNHGS